MVAVISTEVIDSCFPGQMIQSFFLGNMNQSFF